MWCIFNTPEKSIEVSYVPSLYPIYVSNISFFQSRVRFVLAHKINFGTEKMSYTNTNHKFVFVYHKHKKSFGIAPLNYLSKLKNTT